METRKLHRDDVVTGVVQNNRCEYLHEDADKGIDLRYENAIAEYIAENPDDLEASDFEYDGACGEMLIGFLPKDDGTYYPDPDAEYSAIVDYDGFYCAQIVMSKYAVECHSCSPCFPDQGDVDTPGNSYIAFAPPPDCFGENDEFDKSRIFRIEWID